jgi:hypothetical protein
VPSVLGFPPDKARNWTRYAFACRWGLRADPRRRPRLPEFVFAEYLAIAHLKADALLTVDLELAANAQKVTRVASIDDLVATE